MNGLSWLTLTGAILTVAFLFSAMQLLMSRSIPLPIDGVQQSGFLPYLIDGFINLPWIMATIGIFAVWLLPQPKSLASQRLAIALSLIFVQQLTLIFFVYRVVTSTTQL